MKKQLSFSIFIPAFNEGANIQKLLKELLSLNLKTAQLDKIIVASDGSTDNTVKKVREVKSEKILLIDSKSRVGRAKRQNQVKRIVNSDVLFILDADISIRDKEFIVKMLSPFQNNDADLVSARVQELTTNSEISSMLSLSMKLKKTIFEKMNNGDNIYTCHGRVRAFSKRLYKKINYIHSNGEDAYSFLFCKANGYKYIFVDSTEVWYQLPSTFEDHESQSVRFYKSKQIFKSEFGDGFVHNAYKIPVTIFVSSAFTFALKHPSIILYFVMASLLNLKSKSSKEIANTWKISASSKTITR